MTQETKRKQAVMYTSWVVPVAVAGVVAAAVISYLRTVEPQAAPGSPYYTKAVKEAAAGLANPGLEAVPDGRPALPAGYSPEDVAWCEQCKAYHKRQPAAGQAAGAGQPAVGAGPARQATPTDETIPPVLSGLSPDDYYWCPNCKVFHKRPPPGQPEGNARPAAAGAVPAAQPAGAIPALPAGYSPDDYYWCVNCKAYHKRQPAQAGPGGRDPVAPALPTPAAPNPAPSP